MIAEYKGEYFNISLVKKPIRIWKYDNVEGFNKKVKDDGLIVYEKFVERDEIEEVFEIGFSVCWDGQWCGINYSLNQERLTLITNNKEFALSHGMYEFERGVFDCALPASKFQEYRMWKRKLHEKTDIYTILSYDEFKVCWKEMVADLIPPR